MSAIEEPLRGRIDYDGTSTPLKSALFLVVCFAWLVPGLVGHDPWKYDEAVVFGVVTEMLRSGDWVMFRIAGEPYLDKAPLFMWAAAAFTKAFGAILAPHDAARLASGFFMTATLAFLSLACRELMGERVIRVGVLLFIGCIGLLLRAHEMMTDLAGLTGVALGLYGLALADRRPRIGGGAAGLGIGVPLLGNGLLPAGMLGAAMLPLPGASPHSRTRAYIATSPNAPVSGLPPPSISPPPPPAPPPRYRA